MNTQAYVIGIMISMALLAGCSVAPPEQPTQPAQPPNVEPSPALTIPPPPSTVSVLPPSPATGTSTPATSVPSPSTSSVIANKLFPGTVVLGRPTANSITLSLLTAANANVFIQYGRTSGKYESQTAVSSLQKDQPVELQLTGLSKDTRYYYRICHEVTGEAGFSTSSESTFFTQRAAGESFVFTVDADPHFDNNTDPEKLRLTFQNILSERPDFDIDLGDTFMTEKQAARSYSDAAIIYAEKRNTFGVFGGSVPLYLAIGNHDGELGWLLNGTENNVAVWTSKARELYYSNPFPDGFYTGDNKTEPFVGLRENYYAWEWGDALFVVLDPYWYSQGGKGASGWNLTLGKEQYNWLKTTLEKSQAKFKFVFAHNLVGGFDMGNNGNMRGGIEGAGLYEWGGNNSDGSWGFDKNRPGWGKPIHQLLVDNHVTIFFHGHDHFFGRQELDGVVYQECPQPGAINEKNHADEYGYKTGTFLDGAGHLRVTVSINQVKVDFIRTYQPGKEPAGHQNGEVAYSYIINARQ